MSTKIEEVPRIGVGAEDGSRGAATEDGCGDVEADAGCRGC